MQGFLSNEYLLTKFLYLVICCFTNVITIKASFA